MTMHSCILTLEFTYNSPNQIPAVFINQISAWMDEVFMLKCVEQVLKPYVVEAPAHVVYLCFLILAGATLWLQL